MIRSGYALKVRLKAFVRRLDMGCERKELRIIPKFSCQQLRWERCGWLSVGPRNSNLDELGLQYLLNIGLRDIIQLRWNK